mgnify:CR=1 FL=1
MQNFKEKYNWGPKFILDVMTIKKKAWISGLNSWNSTCAIIFACTTDIILLSIKTNILNIIYVPDYYTHCVHPLANCAGLFYYNHITKKHPHSGNTTTQDQTLYNLLIFNQDWL